MTHKDVQNLIRTARKEFEDQQWGYDDNTAVDAFVEILNKHLKKDQESVI